MSANNLYNEIARILETDPGRIAIETVDGSETNYAELDGEVARYANCLTEMGLKPGDRVAVQVQKSIPSLFAYLACLRAGLVYLPLNTAYHAAELGYFIQDAEPKLILTDINRLDFMNEVVPAKSETEVMALGVKEVTGLAGKAAHCDSRFQTVSTTRDDIAAIIYTSGTTGRSKGAMVTHGNLISNAQALTKSWWFSANDVVLHALPIFHVHGLFIAIHCALTSGARLLWHNQFDAAQVLRDIPRASVFMGVPTHYVRLLGEQGLSKAQCAGMRLFISGSAPMLAQTLIDFETRTGHRILERYGMSEAGMITSNPYGGERRAGSVGLPLPGVEVRVTNEADETLPTGETGAIQVKGPNVFAGYWRLPEKTRQEFTADGWFRTGDLGVYDEDGYLAIVGRSKDLIISGGYNVYPKEIELLIDELDNVVESAVVGVAHPDFGEAVTAAVVLQPGSETDEAGMIGILKEKIASYKVPKRIHFLEELPRNAMGKVQKAELRQRYHDDWIR